MEDAVGHNEDDVKHANEDVVNDQEMRDDHDNEDEHDISRVMLQFCI